MGGLRGPEGQFNGSLIKLKDWGTPVTRELKYFCMLGVGEHLIKQEVKVKEWTVSPRAGLELHGIFNKNENH